MKHYIFSGCSFTDMHNSWARYICNKMSWGTYTINAKSGAGNTFISTAAITAALQAESRGETPDISIMWSSPSRFEFPIHPNQTPHFDQLFDINKIMEHDFNPGFYFWGENYTKDDSSYWMLQGGNVSHKTKWSTNRKVNNLYIYTIERCQQFIFNDFYHWHKSLMCFLNVQNLCKHKGWEYRPTVHRTGFGEYMLHCPPQFKDIQSAIDWDSWTFTDDNDGGLREYTLANLNTWDDGYDGHPSYEAQADFAENFWLKKFPSAYLSR